jgi:hypothetical protein
VVVRNPTFTVGSISGSEPAKGGRMKFCTVVNCMDGRVQVPVIRYMQMKFNAEYVDSITEPGPNLILSEGKDTGAVASILRRLKISVERHRSCAVAVVGHHDCAGNPSPPGEQNRQTCDAVRLLAGMFPDVSIFGLWVDAEWTVHEIACE